MSATSGTDILISKKRDTASCLKSWNRKSVMPALLRALFHARRKQVAEIGNTRSYVCGTVCRTSMHLLVRGTRLSSPFLVSYREMQTHSPNQHRTIWVSVFQNGAYLFQSQTQWWVWWRCCVAMMKRWAGALFHWASICVYEICEVVAVEDIQQGFWEVHIPICIMQFWIPF